MTPQGHRPSQDTVNRTELLARVDDHEMLCELIVIFKEDFPQLLLSLQQAVAEQSRPFRLPTSVLWDIHEVKQHRERLLAKLGREPDLQELADSLGWGADRVSEVVRAERIDYAEGGMDLVACPLADAEYERVLERLSLTQLRPLLLRLTDREREVLAARAEGESLRTIGRRLGLSGERVRKIEQQAIEKMAVASKTVDTGRLLITSTG